MSPMNPSVKPTAGERIGKTFALHWELVVFVLGLVIGVALTLLAGVLR